MKTLLIYDYALNYIGGGQKVACLLANLLSKRFEVVLTTGRYKIKDLEGFYQTNLSKVKELNIDLNNIKLIQEHSKNFDVFINAEHAYWIEPLAKKNIMICHFPDPIGKKDFLSKYDKIITNSYYSKFWILQRWKYKAEVLYFFSNFRPLEHNKENIILSVSRITPHKKQLEMIKLFKKLEMKNWRLIIVGATNFCSSEYKQRIIKEVSDDSIELHFDIDFNKIREFYSKSKIFWHLCGINEIRPEHKEVWGLVIIDAMLSKTIPVAFNAGGVREIIVPKYSGFLVDNEIEFANITLKLANEKYRQLFVNNAFRCAQEYTEKSFEKRLGELI